MIIVQKYGGSSVANAERILNVAKRIVKNYQSGNKIVVVLSAQGDTTDELLKKAEEIDSDANRREIDMLVSTGEQQSAALMAIAIHKLGFPAISLNGYQAGIISTSAYGNARIRRIEFDRITAELERNNIVLIAGFQGINRYGDITTLGRGASDTTAVALAAVLNADMCEIYTDVDGIYTADPRIVPTAKRITAISYDEMLELAALGANVLHGRSVEMAKKYNVKMVVRSSMTDTDGTIVGEGVKLEKASISGLATDTNVAMICMEGIKDLPGMAFKVFSLVSREKIAVDLILQSTGRGDSKDICFTVSQTDLKRTMAILVENKEFLDYESLSFDEAVAKLSVVGAGIASNPAIAAMVFEALYDSGINIKMISASEIKISVIIHVRDADEASRQVHDKFFSGSFN